MFVFPFLHIKTLMLWRNDIYRIVLEKFMHKLQHGALHKIYRTIFRNDSCVLNKPDLLTTKIISWKVFLQILEKRLFLRAGTSRIFSISVV